jgi:hypothetical protein
MEPTVFPETSVTYYQSTLQNITEIRRSHLKTFIFTVWIQLHYLVISIISKNTTGLVVSPDKTKYMKFSASPSRRSVKGATINDVTYEGVTEFIYLGMLISNDNSVQKEIQRLILAGNRTNLQL